MKIKFLSKLRNLQPILPGGYYEVEVKDLFFTVLLVLKKPFNVIIAALFCVRIQTLLKCIYSFKKNKIKSVVINKLVLQ